MNAYTPTNGSAVGTIAALLLTIVFLAFLITRCRSTSWARALAWGLAVFAVVSAERLTAVEPSGIRMLAIVIALLYAMKSVVSVEWRAAGEPPLSPRSWFPFATLWVGMMPGVFAGVPGSARHGARPLIWKGTKRLLAGFALVGCARFIWTLPDASLETLGRQILATIVLLPGLSLILHFGLFNILAGLWRYAGAKTGALFRAPLASRSLQEFWGRRWNLAFVELTAIGVVRPLRRVVGEKTATVVAFLFSGFLHELAISLPVRAGYGLPMLYFAMHAAAMQIEDSLAKRGQPISRSPWLGRAWTVAWIVIPLPILFHPWFLKGCLWPLIGMDGTAP